MKPNRAIKKDRYTKARGGSSALLLLRCAKCNAPVVLYQKDGPGQLFRLYLDKIHAPKQLAQLQHTAANKTALPGLTCPQCGTVLAMPMRYVPEDRLAFRLLRGIVKKEKSDGVFPPSP